MDSTPFFVILLVVLLWLGIAVPIFIYTVYCALTDDRHRLMENIFSGFIFSFFWPISILKMRKK